MTVIKGINYLGITFLSRWKICTQKTIIHYWKKLKTTHRDTDADTMFLDWKDIVKILIKNDVMLKGIYRFKSTPMKIPMAFFTEQGHIIKICVETQKVFNSQNDLEKEE